MKLKPVTLLRACSGQAMSIPGDRIEDVIPGKAGYVRILGGPAYSGSVQISPDTAPLGSKTYRLQEDLPPERLARRASLGKKLRELAVPDEEPPVDAES